MSRRLDLKRRRTGFASVAIAGHILLAASGGQVSAKGQRAIESVDTRTAGEPILAIVSLRSQRVTIYDTKGWILRAPVSSGQTGRETPAGIFAVIQKDADHHSNLYDDANIPNMQRITWSGIALHGGPLPGFPGVRSAAVAVCRAIIPHHADGHAGDRGTDRRGADRDRAPDSGVVQ